MAVCSIPSEDEDDKDDKEESLSSFNVYFLYTTKSEKGYDLSLTRTTGKIRKHPTIIRLPYQAEQIFERRFQS